MNNNFLVFFLIIGLPFAGSLQVNKSILLKLQPKHRVNEYLIKEISIGSDPAFGFRQLLEYKVQLNYASKDQNNNLHFNFKQIYIHIRESLRAQGVKIFDTRKDESQMISNYERAYKPLLKEIGKVYRISLNERGEVVDSWRLPDGTKPTHGVFDISRFQIKFPRKSLLVGEKWEYETPGVFTSYLKSKATFWIKKITAKKIYISYESTLISDDLMNGTKAYGEYILDKESGEVLYIKIESTLKATGNKEILEISKI